MAGRVPEHVIQQIIHGVDIVRLVGGYSDLTKKGGRYWGLCPFHKEKTGSFTVDADSGLYYCFGCKEGGSVFTLLQKLEGLSFREALDRLAREAGVDLSLYAGSDEPSRSEQPRLREINELAASFYQKCLEKGRGGDVARDYLAGRQIDAESIEAWRIGYAPDGWDNFLKCACGRGYQPGEIERAGLALPRQGADGHYDRFRGRLMFPIADPQGRTIGFGARALKEEDDPKYLNTPETPLFHKGSSFFGLDRARAAIRTGKTAVVLEGYTDVIMAHQCGAPEAVAVLGTSLTAEHAQRLGRLCERVVLVFDADEAGQRSAARSIEILLDSELDIRVASLPAGQDPCEFLLEHGGEAFREAVDGSVGFFEFRLQLARREHDTSTIQGRVAALRDLAEMANAIGDPGRRDMVVRWLAQELDVRESDAWAYLERRRSRRPRTRGDSEETDIGRRSAAQELPAELLGLMLVHPELAPEIADRANLGLLPGGREAQLIGAALDAAKGSAEWDPAGFVSSLADAELAAIASRAMAEEEQRHSRIRETTLRQRLDGYLDWLEQRELATERTAARSGDVELRAYARRLRDRDSKSARPKQT